MSTEPNPEDVKVQREEDGQWWHPSIPWDDVPEDTDATPLLESLGYEVAFISMESDAPDLADEYFESDDAGMGHWSPSKPGGEGWFLGAIYYTEEGPAACWLRKRMETKSAGPERWDALESLASNDEADAYMFPCDLESFQNAETNEKAFSIRMCSPDKGDTEPLFRLSTIRRALSEPEEPTEAMVKAGADAIGSRLSMANPESRSLAARACWKAMMNAEDQDHD